MILPFSQQLNGKPTHFVERIHKGIRANYMLAPVDPSIHYPSNYNFVAKDKLPAKFHTIREDKKNRWKVGTKIDFFINCRQKDMFRFAPVLPVVSIQEIEIKWFSKKNYTPQFWFQYVTVCVDDNYLTAESIIELSQYDGFDSIEEFFEYFDKDFKGKLIHWTNIRY